MITEHEALAQILSSITPLETERVSLFDALNRYAASDVLATLSLPNFDNSAMDGYAVRTEDTLNEKPLRVIAEQPAGTSRNLTLEPHTAIRIFTGAPMPAGAGAVIMQEDVSTLDGGKQIICNEPVTRGENVRTEGCDLCAGQRILSAGERLAPMKLGVLASQGLAQTDVHRMPRIAVVTTGDELQPPGHPLATGQIYNSNGVMLAALVRQSCGANVCTKHLPDDMTETQHGLAALIASNDFIILSGGVSVGDHDCVKPALQALGIEPRFWRVKIKPGKPVLFVHARRSDGGFCFIFGLPGNPVSSFVTFQLFVRPALLKGMGASDDALAPPQADATLTSALVNRGDRPHYLRGKLCDGKFYATGLQQSHAMFALSRSNALLRLDAGEECEAGAVKRVLMV